MSPREQKVNDDPHSSKGIPETGITLETLGGPEFCVRPIDIDTLRKISGIPFFDLNKDLVEVCNSIVSLIHLDILGMNEELGKVILDCIAALQSAFPMRNELKTIAETTNKCIRYRELLATFQKLHDDLVDVRFGKLIHDELIKVNKTINNKIQAISDKLAINAKEISALELKEKELEELLKNVRSNIKSNRANHAAISTERAKLTKECRDPVNEDQDFSTSSNTLHNAYHRLVEELEGAKNGMNDLQQVGSSLADAMDLSSINTLRNDDHRLVEELEEVKNEMNDLQQVWSSVAAAVDFSFMHDD